MRRNGFAGVRRASVVAMLLLAAGCGGRARIAPLGADAVVLAFGDSLTFGTGAPPGDSYPAVLAKRLGCRVVRSGVPGEETHEGLERLPGVLEEVRPDLVVLCHGGNDMLNRRDRAATARNLEAMIDRCRRVGADVILIAVPRPGLSLRPPRFYAEIARRRKVPIDRGTLSTILGSPSMRSDYVHPNADGYQMLADAVAALIADSVRAP